MPEGHVFIWGCVVKKVWSAVVGCGISLTLLTACTANLGDAGKGQAPLQPLSCIAILPAVSAIDNDTPMSVEQRRSLEEGASLATAVTARQLGDHAKVRLISASQAATYSPELSRGVFGTAASLGKQVGCDGVLTTAVRRFKQRQGTEYASDDPASAEFTMTLVHAGSGAVLWTADFQETQESFLDNILTYDKMQSRGFKWVSVEQLMEQGVSERLASCPYLQ